MLSCHRHLSLLSLQSLWAPHCFCPFLVALPGFLRARGPCLEEGLGWGKGSTVAVAGPSVCKWPAVQPEQEAWLRATPTGRSQNRDRKGQASTGSSPFTWGTAAQPLCLQCPLLLPATPDPDRIQKPTSLQQLAKTNGVNVGCSKYQSCNIWELWAISNTPPDTIGSAPVPTSGTTPSSCSPTTEGLKFYCWKNLGNREL